MLKLYRQKLPLFLSRLVLHVELVLVAAALGHSRALLQRKELRVLGNTEPKSRVQKRQSKKKGRGVF